VVGRVINSKSINSKAATVGKVFVVGTSDLRSGEILILKNKDRKKKSSAETLRQTNGPSVYERMACLGADFGAKKRSDK